MTSPSIPALVAFLGGVATVGGARYKIEVRDLGGRFEARAFNGAAGAHWTDQGPFSTDANCTVVFTKALKKFSEKLKPGRDRVYTNPFPTTTSTMQVGALGAMQGGDLPVHRLIWQAGRALDTLPNDLHRDAMIVSGAAQVAPPAAQPAPAASFAPVTPAPAASTAPATPPATVPARSAPAAAATAVPARMAQAATVADPFPYGTLLMHPNTIQAETQMIALLDQNQWIAQEKKEGRQAQLHRNLAGEVFMTNRSGERVECPPHIAEAMAHAAPGTSIDCELNAEDAEGRAALYVGAGAVAFEGVYTFDLIRSPLLPDTANQWFDTRVNTLRRIVATINQPDAIRLIPTATGTAAKHRLLREVRAREGEGLVLRTNDSPYVSGRPNTCLRWRDRKREMDVVAIPYDFATGRWGFQPGQGNRTGTVSAVIVGLYDKDSVLRQIGEASNGFDTADRRDLQARWDAARADLAQLETPLSPDEQLAFQARHTFVIRVTSIGLNFQDQMIRHSVLEIRPAGDKRPEDCTFLSEAGREWGAGNNEQHQALAA